MGLTKKIVARARQYKAVLLLACFIALITLPFIQTGFAWLCFIGLVPFLYALDEMYKRKWGKTKMIFSVWLSGWIFLLISMSWILQINTGRWSYIPGSGLKALVVFTWLFCTLAMSTGFVFFGWIATKYKYSKWYFLMIPTAWIVSEYFRSWLTALLFMGPEGSFGTFSNFGSLGFAAINTPAGYASRIVGLYGLGGLVILVNTGVYLFIKRKWRPASAAWATAILLAFTGYFAFQPPAKEATRAVAFQVDPTTQRFYESQLLRFMDSNPATVSKPAQIIAMPEYANFFDQGVDDSKQEIVQKLTGGQNALFVYSREKPAYKNLRKNEIVYRNSDGTEISTQEKNFLIPTGEYLPYVHRTVLKVMGQDQIIQVFNSNTGVAKGSQPEHPVTYNSVSYGALACSGAIAPQLYRNMAKQGAEILINNASLNVFKNSPLYRKQSESMIRFSAVANARPFVQAARGNHAYIFDHNGRVLAQTSNLDVSLLAADIVPNSNKTIYTKFGDYIVVVSAMSLAIIALAHKRSIKK